MLDVCVFQQYMFCYFVYIVVPRVYQCVVVNTCILLYLLDVYSDCYRECKSWSELDTCSDKLQFLTATPSSTSGAEEGQLRQRAGKQQTQSSVEEVKPQPKVTAGNPIRWFSCLPPTPSVPTQFV